MRYPGHLPAQIQLPAAVQARGEATLLGKGKSFPRGKLVMRLLGAGLSFLPALRLY